MLKRNFDFYYCERSITNEPSNTEFKVDPAKLYDQFDQFSEDHLIGIANDLSPHYYQMLSG